MAKSYKPERPVTTEKIKPMLDLRVNKQYTKGPAVHEFDWKRKFRKSLPLSKSQMRGYVAPVWHGYNVPGGLWIAAIAISDDKDTKMIKVYLLDGGFPNPNLAVEAVENEAKKLAVLEVMLGD